MSDAMKNQKTQEVLRRWLGENSVAPRKYKDPAAKLKERGNA